MDPQNLFGVHKAEINDNRPCSDLINYCGFLAAVSPFLKLAKTFANTPLQIRTHRHHRTQSAQKSHSFAKQISTKYAILAFTFHNIATSLRQHYIQRVHIQTSLYSRLAGQGIYTHCVDSKPHSIQLLSKTPRHNMQLIVMFMKMAAQDSRSVLMMTTTERCKIIITHTRVR